MNEENKEKAAGFIGAVIPGGFMVTWFYFEAFQDLMNMIRNPAILEEGSLAAFTVMNTTLLLTGLIMYITFQSIEVGSFSGKLIHRTITSEASK